MSELGRLSRRRGGPFLETLTWILLVGGFASFLGSVSQRLTGIGFALIAAPGLVISLGPLQGILIVNICGAISSGFAATQMFPHINWQMYWRITIPAVFFIPLGGLTVMLAQEDLLQFFIGLTVLVALVLPRVVVRFRGIELGRNSDLVAGAFLGYMNSVAGIGGPALIAYSVLAKWDFQTFRATAQPIFFTVGFLSFAVRLIMQPGSSFSESLAISVPFVVTTVMGTVVGSLLAKRVRTPIIVTMSLVIAVVGGLVVLLDAIATLV